jgi:hypothetical protein
MDAILQINFIKVVTGELVLKWCKQTALNYTIHTNTIPLVLSKVQAMGGADCRICSLYQRKDTAYLATCSSKTSLESL